MYLGFTRASPGTSMLHPAHLYTHYTPMTGNLLGIGLAHCMASYGNPSPCSIIHPSWTALRSYSIVFGNCTRQPAPTRGLQSLAIVQKSQPPPIVCSLWQLYKTTSPHPWSTIASLHPWSMAIVQDSQPPSVIFA